MARKFLTPVVPPALASDPASGTAGAIYFNTSSNVLKFYNGTSWTAVGSGAGSSSASSIQALASAPNSPAQGAVYFDTTEQTIKAYNGTIWYDVAGPKELLDHQHYAGEGLVRHVDYGQYVDELNYIVSMDGGTASTSYASAPNNDIIDGGVA